MAERKEVNTEDILRLRRQGLSMKKIADRLGYSFKQVRNAIDRSRREPTKTPSSTKVILRKNRLDSSTLPRGLE